MWPGFRSMERKELPLISEANEFGMSVPDVFKSCWKTAEILADLAYNVAGKGRGSTCQEGPARQGSQAFTA